MGALGEGRWPYRLAVDYTDANQYPFQALQTQSVVVGNPPPAKVAVPAIKSEDIAGSGTLAVTVKNLTPDTRTATVDVLVPDGLEVTGGSRQVTLEGWKEAHIEVPITNRTALVGSRYPVFVVGAVRRRTGAPVGGGAGHRLGRRDRVVLHALPPVAVGARRERRARLAGRGPPPGDSLTAPFAAVMIAR